MTNFNHGSPGVPDQLDEAALDLVLGGGGSDGHSIGVYANIGYLSPATTGNTTVALGLSSNFPFVTGGVFTNHGDGYSNTAGGGISVGGFATQGNASNYFSGDGNSASLAVGEISRAGIEGGYTTDSTGHLSGVSGGLNLSLSIPTDPTALSGIEVSAMHTVGQPLQADTNFNMNGPTGGLATSSPGEYAGYYNASQSPPLDRYEPNSPELNAAISDLNHDNGVHVGDTSNDHAGDPSLGTGQTFNMNPTGNGVPTSSPSEYAGYYNASQSPPVDRYEPASPELNAAINDLNHASDNGDPHPVDANGNDAPPDHFNGNDYNGHEDAPVQTVSADTGSHDSGSDSVQTVSADTGSHDSSSDSFQVASNDTGGGYGGGSDFGGDFGGGDFGGGDVG